jgi:hypothetical protein
MNLGTKRNGKLIGSRRKMEEIVLVLGRGELIESVKYDFL